MIERKYNHTLPHSHAHPHNHHTHEYTHHHFTRCTQYIHDIQTPVTQTIPHTPHPLHQHIPPPHLCHKILTSWLHLQVFLQEYSSDSSYCSQQVELMKNRIYTHRRLCDHIGINQQKQIWKSSRRQQYGWAAFVSFSCWPLLSKNDVNNNCSAFDWTPMT